MESLVDDGLVRAIGVSNFSGTKLKDLLETARIKPAVNQTSAVLWKIRTSVAKEFQSYDVQAKLAVLNGDWTQAEQLLLAHGGVDGAVSMYTEAHRWQDAIRVAETHHHEEAESLKKSHYQWLLETGQEAEAGAVKEADGDYLAAISLYLKGCSPSKAAQVVTSSGGSYELGLLDSICAALEKSGLHEKAGDLYEHLRRFEEAKEAFRSLYTLNARGSLRSKDLLGDTHIHLAQKLESDGDLREAEKHYTAAEE
ncbi:hypothetical protein BSKO_08720 [Bryopsis sp. KO-2023]|nr:hypothetical protein BSKO_08720 [Bryopsis sp. KO-2023]